MRRDVAADLTQSAEAFTRLVWPALQPLLGGEFAAVESTTATGLCHSLDVLAGIDGWQLLPAKGVMRGVACRVQHGPLCYSTFTIRYRRTSGARTEYDKRLEAIDRAAEGWLVPGLTIQAYVSDDGHTLWAACAVETVPLLRYAKRWLGQGRIDRLYEKPNGADGNRFLVIPWRGLEQEGVRLWRWPEPAHGHTLVAE